MVVSRKKKNIPRSRKKIDYFEICFSGVNWNFKIPQLIGWKSKFSFLIGQPSLVQRDDHPNKSTMFRTGGSTNFSYFRIFSSKHLQKKCKSKCLHKIKIPKTCPHCKYGEQCNNSHVKKYGVTSLSQKAKIILQLHEENSAKKEGEKTIQIYDAFYVEKESCLNVNSVSTNISAKSTDKKGKSETLYKANKKKKKHNVNLQTRWINLDWLRQQKNNINKLFWTNNNKKFLVALIFTYLFKRLNKF